MAVKVGLQHAIVALCCYRTSHTSLYEMIHGGFSENRDISVSHNRSHLAVRCGGIFKSIQVSKLLSFLEGNLLGLHF